MQLNFANLAKTKNEDHILDEIDIIYDYEQFLLHNNCVIFVKMSYIPNSDIFSNNKNLK